MTTPPPIEMSSVLQLQNVFFSKQFKSSITITSDKLVSTLDLLCNIYFETKTNLNRNKYMLKPETIQRLCLTIPVIQ